MNAMQYGLMFLRRNIPEEVLDLAYRDSNPRYNSITSLDDRILTKLIRPKIMVDINVVGGIPITIDTSKCKIETLTYNEYIVVVPKSITNNQSITAVHEYINAGMGAAVTGVCASSGQLMNIANNMYNNLAIQNVIQSARLELIGENRILITDPNALPMYGWIRATVTHNANLEDIQPANYPVVGRLFTLGAKTDIYTNLRVKLDKAAIYGGHELSVITDIIEGYADANDMYEEFLTTVWRKNAYINSADNMGRYVKSMLGNTF